MEAHKSSLSISDITLIALLTAVIAVCSWISIPAAVPFTLQTFAVFLTAGLLGGKRGTITVIVYILLGAIGVPVFSGFTGGIGHIQHRFKKIPVPAHGLKDLGHKSELFFNSVLDGNCFFIARLVVKFDG